MSTEDIIKAMDYIIDQTRWAGTFPDQCHGRIRAVCKAVKEDKPLPFLDNDNQE